MRMNDRSSKTGANTHRGDPPASQRSPWTLIFIGAHGETVTVRHFKAWAGFFFLLLIVASTAAIVFYRLSRAPQTENVRLKAQLERMDRQMANLQEENERLMTRLVLYESSAKPPAAPAPVATEAKPEAKSETKSETAPSPEKSAAKLAKPHAQQAVSDTPAEPTAESAATSAPPVEVQSLSVTHGEGDGQIQIQFTIKKLVVTGDSISGRTFVVLKGKDENPATWLSSPKVGFAGDKPESIRKGRYFSIARFNVVRFETEMPAHGERFNRAAVYVYDLQGHLLLKKDFPVSLPAPVPSSRSARTDSKRTASAQGAASVTAPPSEKSASDESSQASASAPVSSSDTVGADTAGGAPGQPAAAAASSTPKGPKS